MRIGVFGGIINDGTIDDVVAEARLVEEQGFASYWTPQIFGHDALTVLAIVGREVPRIELGTSVVPTYPRHPMMLAQQALTANAASGGRLTLGIGLSHQIVIESMMGMSFAKPVRHLREYLAVLGPLSRGESVSFDGDDYRVHAGVAVAGSSPFPIVVAALGPQMLKATAELADGTLTWCTGPETLATYTIPTITQAAEAAGRPAPRVIAALPVCVTDDVVAAHERAAKVFAVYGQLPSYRAMLDREGAGGAADIAIIGPAAEVSERVAALADVGITDFAAVEFGGNPDEIDATRAALVATLPGSMTRRVARAGLLGLTMTLVACSTGPGVRTEEASQRVEDTAPPATNRPVPVSTVEWSTCPDLDPDLTLAWECASVPVPLDHADPAGEQVTVALTRPQLDAGDDRRPLVLDPGGPGASGIELAWYLVDALPGELLDHYYPVGWDPRGVGRSVPPVDCGQVDPYDTPVAADCIAGTGALLSQVGAADAALDLEQVRLALGVDRLDYLGYSYGTALGSIYAMNHPDGVGRFVLDGAIDPTAGDPLGPLSADGVPDYAADELDDVIDRFHELCDASARCAAGPDSAALVEGLESTIRDLPTADFPGGPSPMSRIDLDDVMIGITYDPWSWGLVGDALRDAADGDASTLAALSSYLLDGYPVEDVDDDSLTRFGAAHYAIYCADFSNVPDAWDCDGMPDADPLPVITAVDVAEPIVVIGTSDDPSTPGRHAEEMADALGDAVNVTWEGVGHTAFPVSECLDGLVVDYLVDGVVPADGATCPFVDGLTSDTEIGDHLFDFPSWWVRPWLEDVLVAEGTDDDVARCMADELDGIDHRVLTHLLLGVQSTAAADARTVAEAAC